MQYFLEMCETLLQMYNAGEWKFKERISVPRQMLVYLQYTFLCVGFFLLFLLSFYINDIINVDTLDVQDLKYSLLSIQSP